MNSNDAGRIQRVIDKRIERATKNGATVETTWGEVCGISADGKYVSAYLYGETDIASEDFRLPSSLAVSIGDKVKVAWDGRGERWVYDVGIPSASKKIEIDPITGTIKVGDGTARPSILIADSSGAVVGTHDHDADYSALAHNHDADYSDVAHDHDSDYSLLGHTHDVLAGFGRLRFVPVNRINVFVGATTSVTIARTLTSAIAGIPANARVVSGYITAWGTNLNVSNYFALFNSESGTDAIGIMLPVGATTVHDRHSSGFHVGVVQSGGAKISYTVNRVGGTITYDLFVTGYWTDDA